MSLKRCIDLLNSGQDGVLGQDEWIWILRALDDPSPMATIRSSRRSDLAWAVEELLAMEATARARRLQ